MASTMHFLIFTGFFICIVQIVASDILEEWNVERSSINPLSYTDKDRYSRNWATENPLLAFRPRRKCLEKNEHYSFCDANCQTTCDNYGKPIPCPKFCVWGCICDVGFIRGPDYKCIRPKDCPRKQHSEIQQRFCKENEVWEFRFAHCQRNCSNYDDVILCPKLFVSGCVCDYRNGYVRGPYGNCILIENCPNKKDVYPSEEYISKPEKHPNLATERPIYEETERPQYVETERPQYEETERPEYEETENLHFDLSKFPPYKGSENRESSHWPIPIPLICRGNETLDPCPSTCQDDCNNFRNKDRKCLRLCIPACICKAGLVRSHDGKCIKSYECPQEKNFCPSGEEYSPCKAHCELTCIECQDFKNTCNKGSRICVSGCRCKDGLVRGQDGTCIYPSECSTSHKKEHFTKVCPENEVYEECRAPCQRNCTTIDSAIPCPRICIPGCVCKESMIRGVYGKCIDPEECPKDASPSESDVTLNPPPYTDDDYHIPESVTKYPPVSEKENQLFPETEDSQFEQTENFCPSEEEYSNCHAHCESTCNNEEEYKNRCKKMRYLCISGCTCKEGLVRGPEGTCIAASECPDNPPKEPPTKVCPENEMYSQCYATCQKNCTTINWFYPCPRICIPGCICNENMTRGIDGKCIEKDECPKDVTASESDVTLSPPRYTDDDYHVYEEATKYPPVSEKENRLAPETEDSQFEQTELPPLSQLIPSHHCPPLERWVVCGSHCERNCSNKDDENIRCKPVCIPGCICEQGLVRGPEGECIEKEKCPAELDSEGDQFPFPIPLICGRDENRELCPSTCPDDCNNYKDTNRKCSKVCVPACICKKGLVRGPDGKCIKSSECPEKKDTCRRDEMFSACHGNCEKTCKNWADDLVCPKKCVPGCVCRPGRMRALDGSCVVFSECLKPTKNSVKYPDSFPIEDVLPVEPTENNGLSFSPDVGCPNDTECTMSCRHYGHRYGHCTGRNSLVCSCHIEDYESAEYAPLFPVFVRNNSAVEDKKCRVISPLCPGDNNCDCACTSYTPAKRGECTGPDRRTCTCYMN